MLTSSSASKRGEHHVIVSFSLTIETINRKLTYTYTPTGVSPHILQFKIGIPVMVIRNVLHKHLVNGAMFVPKSFKQNFLCIATVPRDNTPLQTFMLHQIGFQFDFRDFKAIRRQLPIRVAFSATMHKTQGQTLHLLQLN